jgi:tetratricopeptide (TPR) repeat protein
LIGHPALREFSLASTRIIFTTFEPKLYTPLTLLTYQWQHAVVGFSPYSYHLVNLILHILNSCLAMRLILALSGSMPTAFSVALLFALHPHNTEAVVWLSGRKDLLSTCFYLLSLLAFLKFRREGKANSYAASLAFFLLALLAKPMALSLPLLLFLLDFREPARFRLKEKLPFLLLGLGFGIIALVGWRSEVFRPFPWDKRLLLGIHSIVMYLGKFAWPFHLSLMYSYPREVSWLESRMALSILGFTGLAVSVLVLARHQRDVLFSGGFFVLTLTPTLMLSTSHPMLFLTDHYAYLPSVGLFYGVALAVRLLLPRGTGFHVMLVGACLGTVALVYALTSQARSTVWRNSYSIYQDTVRKYPDVYQAWNNLGVLYRQDGRLAEAIGHFEKAVAIAPRYARGHYNLAAALEEAGNAVLAEKHYRHALALEPTRAQSWYGLGNVCLVQGRLREARKQFLQAVRLDRLNAFAHYGLGRVALEEKRREAAAWSFVRCLRIKPDFAPARVEIDRLRPFLPVGFWEDSEIARD